MISMATVYLMYKNHALVLHWQPDGNESSDNASRYVAFDS